MICIECGGTAYNNTELCQNCMDLNNTGAMSMDMGRQLNMSMGCCGACQNMITTDSKQCTSCRKHYHRSCDTFDSSSIHGFVCSHCRRRDRLLSDDVMLSAPPRGVNAPLSPFSDPTGQQIEQINLQMPSGPMTSSYPSSSDFGVEMYPQMSHQQAQMQHMMAAQAQLMDEISDGGATNDSDRNSSPFYQETSDYDEDFVPVRYDGLDQSVGDFLNFSNSRGRGRGASAKKKPLRGTTGTRRSTNPTPGPTGFYSATGVHAGIPQSPAQTRGKRGKRGATPGTSSRSSGKGPGRGRGRGRGAAQPAPPGLQQLQQPTHQPPHQPQVQYPPPPPQSHPMYPPHYQMSNPPPYAAPPPPPPPQPQPQAQIPQASTSSSVVHPQPPQVPTVPSVPTVAPPPPPIPETEKSENVVPDFQPIREPVSVREVDESMMEDDTSRQSSGSRADEQEYIRTAIVCRVNDEFLKKACMCLICGSIGRGAESSMVACSNCAQTYHTYCVNLHDKLNSAVMQRGWRCLDCTVCEGCGTGGDEAKLLLCDECDISYHIYCMKPPLERIPQGPWRCQWCSRCRRCNHKATSGNDLTPQGLCHPCSSLRRCPQCNKGYQLNEKIIRCSQCSKWQHGHCEGLYTEEQLEQAATNRMRCSTCRPNRSNNIGFLDAENVVVCDNVALNKHSDEILKSKYTPSALKSHMMESYGYHRNESFDHYDEEATNADDSSENIAVPQQPGTRGRGRGNPGGRRGMNRIGVGGFYAKLPRHRMIALQEEAQAAMGDDDNEKKAKRPRKPRRSQLEDAYPPSIQEAFFGIRAVEGKTLIDVPMEEPTLAEYNRMWDGKKESQVGTYRAHQLASDAAEMLYNDINENAFLENMDLGNIDTDIDIDFDFSLLIDEDDDELEDSLQGEPESRDDAGDGTESKFGPTTFNQLELQRPATNLPPANFAQQAPGIRAATALSRSGSQSNDGTDSKYHYDKRWEEDEPLGLQATTAAVLYANEKHAYLKSQYPEWSDRVKHIQKLWRTLGSTDRQEYVNRARDNRTSRGRIPRPRRAAQSTNSVDSPTIQSPAITQMGFKVPVNPGEQQPSTSMVSGGGLGSAAEEPAQPPQVKITLHLPPDVHLQYMDMQRVQKDRENLNQSCDQELNKLRKQKKNLAAKKRQLQKTAQAAQDYDGRLIDLNDNDRQLFATLTDRIKQVQADLDNSKKDLKSHESTLREFELRHSILRRESDVNPMMIQQSEARNQMAQAEHLRLQQAQAQGHAIGAPPGAIGPQGPPPGGVPHGFPHPHPQQPRMIPGHPPGAPLPQHTVRLVPPPMVPPELHRRMMCNLKQQQRQKHRWLEMGGMKYAEITDPVMKDCYEFLDEVMYDITFPIDNPVEALKQQQELHEQALIAAQHHIAQQMAAAAAARGEPPPNMLKRILHPPGMPGGPPGGPALHLAMPANLQPGQPPGPPPPPGGPQQMPLPPAQQPQNAEDGPKPKKKRTVQKKATSSYGATGGEYGSYMEKIRTRFRLSEEIPKKQKEPQLNRIGAEFADHGLTEMVVGVGRKPLDGDEFGKMRMKRGVRLFGNYERRAGAIQVNQVSLYQVDPKIRVPALYNATKPVKTSQDEVFQDEMDKRPECQILSPNAKILQLINRRRPALNHIRSLGKYIDEPKAPLAPELSMWYDFSRPEVSEEDVTIELIFNTEELKPECTVDEKAELVNKLREQFGDLVMVKKELPWKVEDTPPDSPAPSSPTPSVAGPVTETRPTASTSRPTSVEKEIKREAEEEGSVPPEVKKEIMEPCVPGGKCRHCQKTIETIPAVRMKMDRLGVLPPEASTEEKEEVASFCTRKCYYELMASSRVSLNHEELTAAEQHVSEEVYNRLKQIHSDNIVKAVSQGKSKLPCAPSVSNLLAGPDGLISPRDTRYMMDEGKKESVIMVPVSSLIGAVEAPKEDLSQRQTTDDWKAYDQGVYESFVNIHHQHMRHVLSPKIGVPPAPYALDRRICVFCGGIGDGDTTKCGRLISLTEYYWVHVNCALWSAEVCEIQTGGLINVDRAVIRASQTLCDHCKRPGASLKCHRMNCKMNYHLICGMQCNGHFIKDRTFICKLHEKITPEVCVTRLDALRRIYVKRDENKMLMRLFDLSEGNRLCMRLGAFTFYRLGSILPRQIKRFHNKDFIFPNKYLATRLFWSPKNHRERMMFECTIEERNDQPSFIVRSLEDPNISYRASSASKAWSPIYERINQLRHNQPGESLKFFGNQISGETLFGLNENAITKITESLPGFDTVFTYQQRHQNSPVLELPLAENPMGCARAEPRQRNVGNHFRTRPQPMGQTHHAHHGVVGSASGQSSQASVVSSSQDVMSTRQAATSLTSANSGRTRGHRSYYTEEAAQRAARAFGINPEYAQLVSRMEPMQTTVQSTFSAYQKMRREWKERVYLARSRIAGLGLYAKIDIPMGEYIIEYKGEVIRSEVCEVRELRYVAQNRGIYMFRLDDEWVIDATMAGGPARYINHSCDPNCSTQIMDAGSVKKIIIMSNRPISAGEELTYDYQFELEDSTDKIPCLCGAPNCVKWMN